MANPVHRLAAPRVALVAAVACVSIVTGCSQQQPAPPPMPPPPRALNIYATQGQSQAQQNKDKAECQSNASAQAVSSETWAQAFTACMGARGYSVQ
jgi:hypothetical protein